MTSYRLRLFVISECTLMLMFPCGHMLRRQSRGASLFYVIFAVYVVLSQTSHAVTRRRARTNPLEL